MTAAYLAFMAALYALGFLEQTLWVRDEMKTSA